MTYRDPRKDGFNYGIGWGTAPFPDVYLRAEKVTRRLRRRSSKASKRAWAAEMALRDLRLAETDAEKEAAIRELERLARRLPCTSS